MLVYTQACVLERSNDRHMVQLKVENGLLQQAVQQSQWVMETEAKLKLEVVSMEGLVRLLKQASVMEQSRVVQVVSRRMRDLLTAAHDWEDEVKTALKQRWVDDTHEEN